MTSFHGLLKILHNITHVIYVKKPLLVSFLHDKRDNSENRMYIVNKCALGVLHMMQRVHLITTDNHYCIGIHEFNICDFLNSKLVTDKILTKRQYLVVT